MKRIIQIAAMGILALAMLAPASMAWPRVWVGGGWGGWWGPGWGWYAPVGFYPYGYYGGYGWEYPPNYPGKVKIVAPAKDDQVFVDGGFVGNADKMKKFPLKPGQHDIEVKDPSGKTTIQAERVTVLPGRTVEVNAAGFGAKQK